MIDINLNGTLYFARLAVAYLKDKHIVDAGSSDAKSISSSKCITLVSSVAGFKESPGLFAYSAAKHGVMGLMRSLRPFTAPLYGLRVNAICTLPLAFNLPFLPHRRTSLADSTQAPGRPTRNSSTACAPNGSSTTCP